MLAEIQKQRDSVPIVENTMNRFRLADSPYQANAQLWDETSWATEKNLHTDQIRTEYRNTFNQPKPFHKMTVKESPGRKKPHMFVYDFPKPYIRTKVTKEAYG